MPRLIRIVVIVALVAVAVGCGRTDNNPRGTDTGPPVRVNAKGPPPMNGPGEGVPRNAKRR